VRRPKIGVRIQPVTDVEADLYGLGEVSGAHVVAVEEGQPAARAGIRPGDVVLALNGRPIADATELTTALARLQPGETVQLTVWRDRRQQQVSMRLAEFERASPPPAAVAENGSNATRLGFQAQQITAQLARQFELSDTEGLVITAVPRSSPAFGRVGAGQVLLAINGQRVRTAAELARIGAGIEPGGIIALRIRDRELGEMVANYRAR